MVKDFSKKDFSNMAIFVKDCKTLTGYSYGLQFVKQPPRR
jgi:hypothetical protein